MRVHDEAALEIEQVVLREGEIALRALPIEAKLGAVALESRVELRRELGETHRAAVLFDELYELAHCHDVGLVVDGPGVGEHEARESGAARLLEDAVPELADQSVERWGPERKDIEHRLDGHVIVEQPVAREPAQLEADRHLTDGRRSEQDEELHAPVR